jgi:hypothetical protein
MVCNVSQHVSLRNLAECKPLYSAVGFGLAEFRKRKTEKGGEHIMKRIGSMVSVLVMVGSLAGSALASDGIVSKEESTADSYCHMKFPAIRERTLAGNNPVLKNSTTGDLIDFYGSCDESPTGKDQVVSQRIENSHHPVTAFYAK